MAPASNWLSFSLMSPMEMLRSSESESPFVPYDTSSTASPHYFLDNFYANGKRVLSLFFNRIFCMMFGCWENSTENACAYASSQLEAELELCLIIYILSFSSFWVIADSNLTGSRENPKTFSSVWLIEEVNRRKIQEISVFVWAENKCFISTACA